MKPSPLLRLLAVPFAAGIGCVPATAAACAACMGDASSKTASAINDAIFLMLGVIGFMLTSLAAFGIYLMKRSNAPLPPHAEFTQASHPPEGNN